MSEPQAGPPPQTAQGIKLLIEFAPLLAFVVAYFIGGIYAATAAIMIAMVIAVTASKLALGKVTPMLMIGTAAVCFLGALTFWFDDPRFFKIKPTIVNLAFATILFGGLLTGKPLLKFLMGEALHLDESGWRKFTFRWAVFFCGLAALNEVVWRNFSESTWVIFKFAGILGLTFLFMLCQLPLLRKHHLDPEH